MASVSYRPGVPRIRTVLTAVLLLLTLTAPSAGASAYSQVLKTYEAHGRIPPCQFSSQELASALKGIDTYGAQYFADFSTAVQAALQSRAAGACSARRKRAAASPPVPNKPVHIGSVTQPTGAGVPAPLLILAVLAALIAVGSLLTGLVWWRGWSPAWAAGWRHMWSEATFRAQGTLEDFQDWRRSGSRSG
jgi:hypothetical protein